MPYFLTQVNEAIRRDPAAFAAECDAAFATTMAAAAGRIADHRGESRVVLLSGPSASGKTTAALKMKEQMKRLGVKTHTVSMDNYFNTIDSETAPRTRDGEIDYESPFCLDMELLNRHFSALDRGEIIHIPKYEFARQMRTGILSQSLRLERDELAIFEGIHALNDIIAGKNPKAFKLYIATCGDLVDDHGNTVFPHSWLRLCRRIVRDYQFRGSEVTFTLNMWANIRRGEELYISPYRENAHIVLDSSLAFEAAALKPFVVPLLEEIPAGTYPVVDDMLRAFEKIEAMDERFVAPDSLAREFIGGSTYDNH